jgi:hypothetical protein
VPEDAVEISQKYLDDMARQFYDSTKPDKDGRRYRFNGTLELLEAPDIGG